MYQAWRRPGMKPSTQRRMLMTLSAEQMPHLTQTAMGGKRMARTPRKISEEHMLKVDGLFFGFGVAVFTLRWQYLYSVCYDCCSLMGRELFLNGE